VTPTPDQCEADLWRAWRDAAATELIDRAIAGLYAELDAEVARRGPTCWLSGKCCHFDAYGHRLYVTGLEIAWVLTKTAPRPAIEGGCMFQQNKLCTVHAVRPLGCRIFFCQEGTQAWQNELYEAFLARLRTLHETHALPYRYMEWRAGLAAALAVTPSGGDVTLST
jgi:Fe-S-cluster containining protein